MTINKDENAGWTIEEIASLYVSHNDDTIQFVHELTNALNSYTSKTEQFTKELESISDELTVPNSL